MKVQKYFKSGIWVIILAVFCNILWGSAFPFIKIGYREFAITTKTSDIILFAGMRFFLAGLLLLASYGILFQKLPKIQKENWKIVGSLGIVQTTFQYIFFYIGVSNTTSTNGSIVNSTSVFLTTIIAHFAYANDKLNARKVIGCIFGFLGVILITLGKGSARFTFTGEGYVVIAALMFSFGSLISKRATEKDDSWLVTAYNLSFGGFLLIVLGLLMGGKFHQVTIIGVATLIYLASLSAIAFTVWSLLLKYNDMSKICIFNFVIPVSGTLLSGLLLKEDIFQAKYLVSLALVCVGIYIVNHRKLPSKAV